jgi:hypothetical protein
MCCQDRIHLHEAEELLKVMYRKNRALEAAAKASEELRHEQYKDMERLRVHVQELVKHIDILVKENGIFKRRMEKYEGCYKCCEKDHCMNVEEVLI